MRILMLGNSFTFYHDMPDLLAKMTGAEVTAFTRGGASLKEHSNPETELGSKIANAFIQTKWDYVVLQEQSVKPAKQPHLYLDTIRLLGATVRENGGTPIIYGSWAYEKDSDKLVSVGLSQDEMDQLLSKAFLEASTALACPLAPVGQAFALARDAFPLYNPDHLHPSPHGSYLAAATIGCTMGFALHDVPFLDVSLEDRVGLTQIAHQACANAGKVDQP